MNEPEGSHHSCEDPDLCRAAERGVTRPRAPLRDEDPWAIEES